MKGVTMGMSKGIKGYWRKSRKGYERLDGSGLKSKKRLELVTLGGSSSSSTTPTSDPQPQNGNKRRRRFWGIKITPKLKIFLKRNSPKKILKKLRDAYVNMMLGFANSSVFSSGFSYVGNGGYGDSGFTKPVRKEYDEKAIVEFYKSLMAQGQLMPRDAAKIVANGGGGGLVLCRRPLPSGF
ncbi:hypothetical protein MKW98_015348 [Papaver atlanticum]|uniref:Uncharacterized protein n=1 Tax=Papaver atlanticum TaxID=357466 RepID=A0AAD4T2X9_9MAGN|nr:hypothetical protein MKW98_015348 [Papaver atlanticum]